MSTHSVSTSLADRRKEWQDVDVTDVICVSDSEDEYSGHSDATPNAAQRLPEQPVQEPEPQHGDDDVVPGHVLLRKEKELWHLEPPVQEQPEPPVQEPPVQEPSRPLAIAYHASWHADHASSSDEAVGPTPDDTSGDDSDDNKVLRNKRKAGSSIDDDAQESPSSKKPRKKATKESIKARLEELEVQLDDLNEYQTLADIFTARDLIARLANPHQGSELDMKGLTSAFQALKKPWADAKRIDSLKKQIASLKKQQERLLKRKATKEATAEERAAKKQRTKKDKALQKKAEDARVHLEMIQLRAGYKVINKKASLTPKEKAYMDRLMTTCNEPVNGQPSEEHFNRNNPNPQNPLTALKSIQDDSNESDWESTDDEAN